MIRIRRAGPADAPLIAALEPICFGQDAWSLDMVEAEFSGLNDTRYFVAECVPEESGQTETLSSDTAASAAAGHSIQSETQSAGTAAPIVGYAGIWLIKPEGYITNVAVHPDHRRRKIAQRLLSEVFAECERCEVTDVTLEVRVSNAPAIALYEGFGFESAGIRKRYYNDGEDAVIMWRRDADKSSAGL